MQLLNNRCPELSSFISVMPLVLPVSVANVVDAITDGIRPCRVSHILIVPSVLPLDTILSSSLLMNMAHVTDRMRCGLGPVLFPPRGIDVLCASGTTLIGLYTGILDRSAFFFPTKDVRSIHNKHIHYTYLDLQQVVD